MPLAVVDAQGVNGKPFSTSDGSSGGGIETA
jgi:hypothetical protein